MEKDGARRSHCFRRGGAQHRFMHFHDKWSLKAVRWWGRWRDEVGDESILKYLSNSCPNEKYYFGDMLSPDYTEYGQSASEGFAESKLPVTCQVMKITHERLRSEVTRELSMTESRLRSEFDSLRSMIAEVRHCRSDQQARCSTHSPTLLLDHGNQDASTTNAELLETETSVPRIPTISSWKQAIQQWDVGDISRGLTIPLSDWTSKMKAADPSKYSQRKLIVAEFEYFGRDENKMEGCHGSSLNSIGDLIRSIRAKSAERKHPERNIGSKRKLTEGDEQN